MITTGRWKPSDPISIVEEGALSIWHRDCKPVDDGMKMRGASHG